MDHLSKEQMATIRGLVLHALLEMGWERGESAEAFLTDREYMTRDEVESFEHFHALYLALTSDA